jgi:Flp pilus assembly protein TadG
MSTMTRRFRRRRGWRSGSSAVEFALISPLVITLLVGIVDYGLATTQRLATRHAAQAGAEQAALHGFDATKITTAMQNASPGVAVAATPAPAQSCGCASGTTVATASCGSTCADGTKAGTYVTVNAQSVYTTVIPYPGFPSSFTFTERSFVRIQ